MNSFAPLVSRGDAADLFLEESSHLVMTREDGRLDDVSRGRSSGAGLRYVSGAETRFAAMDARSPVTEGLSITERRRLERSARDLGKGLPSAPPPGSVQRAGSVQRVAVAPSSVPLEEKAAMLERADKAARFHPSIRQVSLTCSERAKRVAGLSVEGPWREDRTYVSFIVQVTAVRDGLVQTATEVVGGLRGWELFKESSPEEAARRAARRALEKLDAPPAPLGEMSVVLAAEAGGTMIHEAIGHALEADAIQEGSSPHFAGKLGRVVANEKVSVVDDPTLAGWRGSFVFDDEGVASRRTLLVENGVLKNYLYDRITAARAGLAPNGHGRRESYKFKPIPRMSNTFVLPGPDDPAEILSSLEKGLLVTRMGGGQVNTTTGEFVFEVEEGFLVENGKVKHRVRGANLLGLAPEVLRGIDKVGRDMGWGLGTCGKAGQGVPVTDGLPTLRIPKILIGGTQP